MSLIDRIKKEQKSSGTCVDGEYVRNMEAALLAADRLADAAKDMHEAFLNWAIGKTSRGVRLAERSLLKDRAFLDALAAYREATK